MKKIQIVFTPLSLAMIFILLNFQTAFAQSTIKNNLTMVSCTAIDANGKSCTDKNCNNKCDKDETYNTTPNGVLSNINSSQLRGTIGGTDPCRISICNGYPLNFFKQQTPAIQQSIIQQREKGIPLEKVIVNGKRPFAKKLNAKTFQSNHIKSIFKNLKPASPK